MGLIHWLFGRHEVIEPPPPPPPPPPSLPCLSCLERTELKTLPLFCDACGAEVPPLYATAHQKFPPLGIQVFGLSQHGKTLYLYALTMMLKRLQRLWQKNCQGYTFTPISEESRMRAREIDRHLADSEARIASTALSTDDVFLALLEDMPRWNHRALAVRDTAGEAFDKLNVDTNAARFLLSAAGTLMMISFESFKVGDLDAIEGPLNSYVNTLLRSGKSPQGRQVVVAFTKADMQLTNLPASLREYLLQDPLAFLADSGEHPLGSLPAFDAQGVFHYLEGMKLADREIRSWLERSGHGNSLDVLARRFGIELRYCMVSATGGPVSQGGAMPDNWSPKRVLDPFFWFLEMG